MYRRKNTGLSFWGTVFSCEWKLRLAMLQETLRGCWMGWQHGRPSRTSYSRHRPKVERILPQLYSDIRGLWKSEYKTSCGIEGESSEWQGKEFNGSLVSEGLLSRLLRENCGGVSSEMNLRPKTPSVLDIFVSLWVSFFPLLIKARTFFLLSDTWSSVQPYWKSRVTLFCYEGGEWELVFEPFHRILHP